MIANVLGHSIDKIYARNTEVKAVDGATAFKFLEQNHRQGGVNSKIRLGLYYNNKLVSLMTFNLMRNTIGRNTNTTDCWELVRFCNILNTNVVGGASKLFKYFCKQYTPNRIRSFSDIAHTRGNLYKTLGFNKIHQSDPGYVWVDSYTDLAYHRVNAQKHNIKKFLQDDNIDLSQTERDIMVAHGYLQVYDSGTILWEWCR